MSNLTFSSEFSRLFPGKPHQANYRINWSLKHKMIYVETAKVGCTTIKQILQFAELDYDESRIPTDIHDRELSPLKAPIDDEELFLQCLSCEDNFTFSFVRNPFTRVLSAYLDKIATSRGSPTRIQQEMGIDPEVYIPTFAEFVDTVYDQSPWDMNPHWAPQTFLLGMERVRYDYLGRFEFFKGSIDHLLDRKKLKLPKMALTVGREHATGADTRVLEYYSKPLVKRIQEIYEDDFRLLGYGWSL